VASPIANPQPRAPTGIQLPLQLHLETFDGPLELLLALIEQRRLPITQVSLAQVADQYLAQVHALPQLDRDLLADFLAIAGRLLLLKSRALLLTEEPDPLVEEVASDLAERLATYRVFRAASERLREIEHRGERTYPASRAAMSSAAPPPLAPTTPDMLLAAWRHFVQEPDATQVDLPGVARVSVDERRVLILDALRSQPRVSFRALAGDTVDQVVATFLAILELFRRGLIGLEQTSLFGELTILRASASS
jgi:segregation and condensation protein A